MCIIVKYFNDKRFMTNIDAHNQEIQQNIENWKRKPLLREIYKGFHELIANNIADRSLGKIVELGSGVADITEVIPDCIRTDLFPNPWIDQTENAYDLSFNNEEISTLILFDVFHHLRYPGTALKEFNRVISPGGRLLIFEPYISMLGWIVYGPLHNEPIGYGEKIQWEAPKDFKSSDSDYYAAQGNATRIFLNREIEVSSLGWHIARIERLCSVSYVASGGYSKPQMYPLRALPVMRGLDRLLGRLPRLFGTRLLIVLEKKKIL